MLKKEDNKYNKNNDYISLGINIFVLIVFIVFLICSSANAISIIRFICRQIKTRMTMNGS